MNTAALLEIENFEMEINDKRKIRIGNFQINKSERIWCRGPSGSGKSQFLKSLFFLRRFQAKQIKFKGQVILSQDYAKLRSIMAYIPQEAVFYHNTPGELLLQLRRLKNPSKVISTRKFHQMTEEYFPKFNFNQNISTMSGGERQALHLLLVLSQRPEILILDESFSAMDNNLREKLENCLFQHSNQASLLFVHHLEDPNFLSPNSVLCLTDGEHSYLGSPQENRPKAPASLLN